jgi:hypothetical protein
MVKSQTSDAERVGTGRRKMIILLTDGSEIPCKTIRLNSEDLLVDYSHLIPVEMVEEIKEEAVEE